MGGTIFPSRAAVVSLVVALGFLLGPVPPAVMSTTDTPSAVGSIVKNPFTGRREIVVPDIGRTAVLIGDSQSSGRGSWPQVALRSLGYSVRFAGANGTGFVASTRYTRVPNYHDSLTSNRWVLPHGDPALVVVGGGGNDATQGVSDGDILRSANALVLDLQRTYPSSRLVMVGTLSRSAEDGGGRRTEVDALLGDVARTRGVPFVSAGDWLTTHGLEAYLADEVHLAADGHRRAAVILEDELRALRLGAADVLGARTPPPGVSAPAG
ncbi:SGNH/GDSL hydrolase family protein [Arthrobacter sp. SX1312]|uniref:SGNH/GDSL hydrolase family protein n=1 Tax=Arthrobacter sp. SX1312 TaxID=2058896 RepID=UPI000CE49761|nr:SGNH/GDSL hydrolase family protein [Arthrobacter sp. SX1312]